MRMELILFVLFSVLLSSGSQVLMKYGMTTPEMQAALQGAGGPVSIAITIATSPAILFGLGCFGLSAVVWLFVLSKIPLSSAYPFVALGIAITVIAGRVVFDEPVTLAKLVGVVLIIVGVTTVAVSS